MWLRRIILLLIIILTAVFASFYGGPLPYALFFLSLLVPLLSFLYLYYIYHQFRVYQLIDKKTLVKYETVPFCFVLANEDILTYTHIRVTFLDDYSTLTQVDTSNSYTLLPGEREEYKTTLMCRYCGTYRVGIDHIILEDFFGLFRLSYRCPSPLEVHVLPRVLLPERLSFYMEATGGIRLTNNQNSFFPDAETRKYQTGDPLRTIHWKAFARNGELLTRKQLPEPRPEQYIFLDMALPASEDAEYFPRFDRLAETTLAISNYYLNNHTPCNVYLDADGLQHFAVYAQKDFDLLYSFFCKEERLSGSSAVQLLRSLPCNHITNTKCIIITTQPQPELIQVCEPLLDSGNYVTVLCLCDDDLDVFRAFTNEQFCLLQIPPDHDLLSALERL